MERYRVSPGKAVALSAWDPCDTADLDKAAANALRKQLNKRLESLQELLYAEGKQRVLIVLQAMDTGGKDGTIRHVFEGVNPQGVKVASFKAPTPVELAHDYLWRIHQRVPANGEITIFNRSHYEDVLVVRVHNLVPEEVWRKRYAHIVQFERMLADEGTIIRKFYLHISPAEQKTRLQERLDNPKKHWKFSRRDLAERQLWPTYMEAYAEMLEQTSTQWAPWYIIPADRKWFRNLLISQIMVETLESLQMAYPAAEPGLDEIVIE